MSDLSIKIPDSLYKSLQSLAQKDDISIDQFISIAIAEKISALMTQTYLQDLAKRGNRPAYDSVLAGVPDIEPEEYDRLPSK